MWAIDTTDVFVFCYFVFTPSPSVLRTATSPSQEGEAGRDGAEKAKEKGHPEMSFMDYFILPLLYLLLRPVQLRWPPAPLA